MNRLFPNPATKDIIIDKYVVERIISLMDKAKSEIGSAEVRAWRGTW